MRPSPTSQQPAGAFLPADAVPPQRQAREPGETPTRVYEAALRSRDGRMWVRRADGQREQLPVATWRGGLAPGDGSLLRRCAAPVLDIGCGPGRLAAALTSRGVPALGVDVAPFAVLLARREGVAALCRDVFDPLPGEGRWSTLLLADGNIGIGGDPGRLLARAAELLAPSGRLLAEVEPAARAAGAQLVRLEGPAGQLSRPFPWAFVGREDVLADAASAGLRLVEAWRSRGRCFVALGHGA